jgi:hypothetical protein
MAETLEIPVTYKHEELLFKAHVVRFGYVHHIMVDINGSNITIERDEEGSYRALGDESTIGKADVELVKEIVQVLESL